MRYSKWNIPRSVLAETEKAFARGQHEVFVIWSAPRLESAHQEVADIRRCIVPAQKPGATPSGVWVHIAGQELQRIQLDNFKLKERSIVQLHTHPGADVNMSRLDIEWEVVRHIGALSIIVPFYGKLGLNKMEGVNVYEREENGWRLWTAEEIQQRLLIS